MKKYTLAVVLLFTSPALAQIMDVQSNAKWNCTGSGASVSCPVILGATHLTNSGSAIKISCRVAKQRAGAGRLAVGAARKRAKCIEDCLLPASVRLRRQLKDGSASRAAALSVTTRRSCSVQIPSAVGDQHRIWVGSVCSSVEVVQDRFPASFVHLKNGATAEITRRPGTAIGGHSVQVACGIADHSGIRQSPVRLPRKVVQHRFLASLVDLEHRPRAVNTACNSSAVESSGRVLN